MTYDFTAREIELIIDSCTRAADALYRTAEHHSKSFSADRVRDKAREIAAIISKLTDEKGVTDDTKEETAEGVRDHDARLSE